MTDTPATQIGGMVMILLQLRHASAQRTLLAKPPRSVVNHDSIRQCVKLAEHLLCDHA